MISLNKYSKHDVFRESNRLLSSENSQVRIKPISLACFEAKVVSTKDFDNNYSKQLEYCYKSCASLIDELFNSGFTAWIFDIGPFLTQEKLQKINNYTPFGNLKKMGLDNVSNIHKCYEFPDGIKCSGFFLVNKLSFYNACEYIQSASSAVIIMSKRNDMLSELNLNNFFYNSIYENNAISFASLNWATLCLEICPQGDLIIKVGGKFDDLYRSILLFYYPDILNADLRDLLLIREQYDKVR